MTIDLRNVAFIIKEIWWEGDLLKGRIETANTACGHDMKGLIEQGCKVAFSLRAQGNVHTNPVSGIVEVEDGLQILGYDWVQVPSHAKAFMEKICEATVLAMYKTSRKNLNSQVLCESEDFFMNGGIIDLNTKPDATQLNYTKNYTPKFKLVSDMYIPEENDEVKTLTESVVTIENPRKNVVKTVLTEDFLVKDIRNRIHALFVESQTANGPELDQKAEELDNEATEKVVDVKNPELVNTDVYPDDKHEQTEDVEGLVITESSDDLDWLATSE